MNRIVTGLGFGDEGKGVSIALLANKFRDTTVVVKYTGGCQCAHNVSHADGRHHIFSQWGSASFEGVPTYIGPNFLFSPTRADVEAKTLENIQVDAWKLLHVDERARVVTPYHAMVNRITEVSRGDGKHGSCGAGIGETVRISLAYPGLTVLVKDLLDPKTLKTKIFYLREYVIRYIRDELKMDPFGVYAGQSYDMFLADNYTDKILREFGRIGKLMNIVSGLPWFAQDETILFEGSQGMLLDELRGFNPHTTWADLSPKHARLILHEAGMSDKLEHWPVIRSYMSRHGAGPMPSEAIPTLVPDDKHNVPNQWQGPLRKGAPDFPMWRSSLMFPSFVHPGEDVKLMVSHMDLVNYLSLAVNGYEDDKGMQYDRIPFNTDAEGLKRFKPQYRPMPYFADAEEALGYYAEMMSGRGWWKVQPGDWISDPCPTRRVPIK